MKEYGYEINYWFFLIENRLVNQAIPQMEKQFQKTKFYSSKLFDPTLLVAVFDPNKVDFGKKLTIKAIENSMQMVLPPQFKLQFPISE